MYSPYVFPIMAWAAAISEEGTYRLFGIAFFLKLVRFRFLAVLLPSILWALGHTEYAIYPVYTRLIEVTLLGLVFGYAFLKYGFLTALFAHACMDSVLMGLSLWSISTWPGLYLGLIYIASPFVVAWIIYWLHSRRQRRRQRQPLPPPLPEAP
jgi:ABC-type sulfate transport system permease subunit